MTNATKPLLISAAIVLGLTFMLLPRRSDRDAPPPLVMYCAAVMRAPIEEIARAYQHETGVTVQLQFGGSGTLLSNLQLSGNADLYLAADASYIDRAQEKGLVANAVPVARLRPVLLVQPGNPKGIHDTAAFLRPEVRVSLANPDTASIGNVTRRVLSEQGQWPAIEAAVRARGVFKPTVTDVANDVKLGAVDAGIVWDATARQYPGLEMLPMHETDGTEETIMIAVLNGANNPQAAIGFVGFLRGESGKRILAGYGF